MKNLENYTIKELSILLKEKKVNSVESTHFCLTKIEKLDKNIKAFITVFHDTALSAARESDLRRSRNKELSPIDGIPISIKDNILTEGLKTTAGSKMLEDFVPAYDATIVERLKNAGAVIIGKTNLDAWAHGSSTENSDFFTTHNPHDLSRVPGGSSGGSCAAVAANLGFASIGTDAGGSIRQPAGFCGVVGLKPTYGRVSRYGLVAMASSLDCPGPITKTAEDAAILLEIICGHDLKDSTTVPKRKFSAQAISHKPYAISNLKIGLPKEYFAKGLDPKVEKSVMNAVEKLEKAGAKIKQISLPNTDYALAVYYIIQPAEVSSNLARYDGIKYGFSIEKPAYRKSHIANRKNKDDKPLAISYKLNDVYNLSRAYGFGAEAKRRIMIGTHVLSSGYYDAYYKKAMKVRTLVCQDFERAFKEVDVIITPISPTLPFKIGENISDPLAMYLSDVYTVSANIAGIPGISIPCGYVDSADGISHIANRKNNKQYAISHKLPVGMQILGPQFSEEQILSLANHYENS